MEGFGFDVVGEAEGGAEVWDGVGPHVQKYSARMGRRVEGQGRLLEMGGFWRRKATAKTPRSVGDAE